MAGMQPVLSREALERARAYAAAGASGLFIPGLKDATLIGRIVEGTPLPVNVMVMDGVPSNDRLAELGVARISYGPIPYIRALNRWERKRRRCWRRRTVGGLSHEQCASPDHDDIVETPSGRISYA